MEVQGYQIKEAIFRSARTLVWRARRVEDGASVIIKSLARDYPSAEEIAQLEFEYRILRKLDAPAVLRAFALVRTGNNVALVLEDFEGASLPSCAGGPEALDVFFGIAGALARALAAVHARGIIHKDIKPRNVLMNPVTREVKLIDFNSATELSREHLDGDVARRQEGSLAYMSPEQTGRMNRDLDYRGDYYSLGVTFFELLSGTLPFSAADTMGWIHCHISKPVPDLRAVAPAVPEPLSQIVRKLMAKNADDRYQSARGLLMDLTRCEREWRESRAIASFALGAHDVPERFQISKKLFGREGEAAALLEAFEAASTGPSRLLLVGGYSGVGKSSLIHEIQRTIVRSRGHFVAGKFDQLERNVPYAALLEALRSLIKQLLAEPEESVDALRARLSAAFRQNGRVLADLIPEIEQLLGSTAPVPDVGAQDARARLQRMFRELIQAIARPEHPLVVFVDDLQWTDAATPELLISLLGDETLRHVLFIGAYRDNEVKEGHLLSLAMKELEAVRPGAVSRVRLAPLSQHCVEELLVDTLRGGREDSAPLAALVYQKTAGNPFFINELLRMLHRDGAFHFLADEGRWAWDPEKIAQASVTDNVVDLMLARLRALPPRTLEDLRVAACLGAHFDLVTLARVTERPPSAIAAALWEAVSLEVLLPLGSSYRLVSEGAAVDAADLSALRVEYRFQHDRVQHAAYLLLDERERARVHLRIGRLRLAAHREASADENLFEIVNHLNLGRELITEYEERKELSRLNGVVGQRARRSAAYAIATSYWETSLGLLSEHEWASEPELQFENARARAECVLLTGDIGRANALADELIASAPGEIARGRAVELKVAMLEYEGRMLEAVDAIRRHLRAFGVELPEEPAEIERRIGEGIAKMQAHLARVRVEDLVHLPELEDPELCTATNLLFQVIPSAIQTYPPLFILAELIMFDIALTHGRTAVHCKNFVDCGIIQGGILGDYATGYRLGKAAFAMLERYAPTPLESAVTFVFAAFIAHWRAPVREGFEAFARALRAGLELGDPRHSAFTRVHVLQRMLLVGSNLEEAREEGEQAIAFLEESQAGNALAGARAAQRVVSRLAGRSGAAHPSDEFTTALAAFGNAQWLFSYGQAETMASLVLGDLPSAEAWQAFTEPVAGAGLALFAEADYSLFRALILVRRFADQVGEARESTLAALLAIQEKLRVWSENCPTNFAHKYKLCSAEIARVQNAPTDEVLALYDEAIAAAGDGFVHIRALTSELIAEYWVGKRQHKVARHFCEEAYYLYERWGAHAKLRKLELRYPDWLGRAVREVSGARTTTQRTTRREDRSAGALDLESIIKATQAISSEVRADRLFARLMATIIENAGAERGCLILDGARENELVVAARAAVHGDVPDAARAIPLADCGELCPEVVRYVARTRDTVVVDDATRHGPFADYAYIHRNAVKSLLCMPILNQGKLVAILYAENNATTHAFTSERLSLLQVIASQAAISITNARLYDRLEDKVAERTRELVERNRDIAAMLNSMQQGIFTVGENMTIQPQYSAHLEHLLGRTDIAGNDCLQVVFDGSSVGADALETMRSALVFTLGESSVFADMNSSHLVREFARVNEHGEVRHFEVDWNPIVDETDTVQRVLVALRDVTVVKQLKETVAKSARELEMLGHILDAGIEPFQRFCASSRALLGEVAAVVGASAAISRDALELCFRNMHTIKGNARMLGLGRLVDTAHLAEEPYAELRCAADPEPDAQKLAPGVHAVLAAIDDYERVYQSKLGEAALGVSSASTRAEQALRDIQRAIGDAQDCVSTPAQVLRSVERAIERAQAVPLSEVVKECARVLPSLARELHKAPPLVDCESRGLLLTPAWAQVMRDVLSHAFRNALDHGLEPPEERELLGKPAQGRIRVRAERTESTIVVRLADDGRGLRLGALRDRIRILDAPATDEDVASAVFVPGVSTATAVSGTSGRGVGMGAIRSFVEQHGGDVRLVFTGESRSECRPFELLVRLPESAAIAGAEDSKAPLQLSALA